MAIDFNKIKISDTEKESLKISNLADRPNAPNSYGKAKMSAQDIKQAFDNQFDLLVNQHNQLVDGQGSLGEMYGDLHGALEAIRDIQKNLSETMVVELKKDEENGADEENDEKVDASVFALLDKIYPVGSIYMSMNSQSPSEIFGGTWEQIQGRFLIGTDQSETEGETKTVTDPTYDGLSEGGSASHKHTLDSNAYAKIYVGNVMGYDPTEVGVVSATKHNVSYTADKAIAFGDTRGWVGDSTTRAYLSAAGTIDWGYNTTEGAATPLGGATMNTSSLPPYLAVYMW